MEISITQKLTSQFQIDIKAQQDAVARLQLEISQSESKHQTEIHTLTVKLNAISQLEAQITSLRADLAGKEKQFNLSLSSNTTEMTNIKSQHTTLINQKQKEIDGFRMEIQKLNITI